MSAPIRILVVDDHPMVAEGIQSLLENYDDLEVLGTLETVSAEFHRMGRLQLRLHWSIPVRSPAILRDASMFWNAAGTHSAASAPTAQYEPSPAREQKDFRMAQPNKPGSVHPNISASIHRTASSSPTTPTQPFVATTPKQNQLAHSLDADSETHTSSSTNLME